MTWLNWRPAEDWEEPVVAHGLECELDKDRALVSGVKSEQERPVPVADLTLPAVYVDRG